MPMEVAQVIPVFNSHQDFCRSSGGKRQLQSLFFAHSTRFLSFSFFFGYEEEKGGMGRDIFAVLQLSTTEKLFPVHDPCFRNDMIKLSRDMHRLGDSETLFYVYSCPTQATGKALKKKGKRTKVTVREMTVFSD